MKKLLKLIALISLGAILLGGVVFLCGFIAAGGSFKEMTATTLNYKTHTAAELPTDVAVKLAATDLEIVFDENATGVTVKYPETETTARGKMLRSITLTEGSGKITLTEKTNFLSHILFFAYSYDKKVTITLPKESDINLNLSTNTGYITIKGEGRVKNLTLKTDTGDISAKDAVITADTADFEVDTGKVSVGTLNATALKAETDTGDLSFSKINVTFFEAETDTGDLRFGDATVSGTMKVSVDTGEIYLTGRLTAANVIIDMDTGDVRMKDGVVDADKITVETDTGDVFMTLSGVVTDYSVITHSDTGDSNLKGNFGGSREVRVTTDTGDIRIYFEQQNP
ncbi:MAG: DUF4097 family beta strand repeat protein [Clostridia bacterium]|nr:DUF4097 family beta strand repeat protein [Clostridia bacterium]